MTQTDIIIVGAGMAGLMAARELSRAGKSVIVLEARDRIGGRVYAFPPDDFGYPAQGGAEFIHGSAPITSELVEKAGITLQRAVEWWDVRDGEPSLVDHGSHLDALLPAEVLLSEKLMQLKRDMTVDSFLEHYFSGEEYARLRARTRQRIELYDAADCARASSFALRDELHDEEGKLQRSLKEGYGALLDYIKKDINASGVQIILNAIVGEIDTSDEYARVRCADGTVYEAAKVINTVPLPCIKYIRYIPEIPRKMVCAEEIGFGTVIKILIRFESKWWVGVRAKNFERMFYMFSNEAIAVWWTQYPEPHATLTGWIAGPKAEAMADMSDSQLYELAIISLSNIFKISDADVRKQILTGKVCNWSKDPFALGAYSYTTPESAAAIKELLEPVDGKLYFAGEALGEGGVIATVEAALTSGFQTAQRILSS